MSEQIVPTDLAHRIELYPDDAPMYGDHSDVAGGNCWELLREAMEELRGVADLVGRIETLEAALREIAESVFREVDEPLDDAVMIANRALAPAVRPGQEKRPDLSTVEKRNAFYSSEEYRNMTTAEKCVVQGDGFINDYD